MTRCVPCMYPKRTIIGVENVGVEEVCSFSHMYMACLTLLLVLCSCGGSGTPAWCRTLAQDGLAGWTSTNSPPFFTSVQPQATRHVVIGQDTPLPP